MSTEARHAVPWWHQLRPAWWGFTNRLRDGGGGRLQLLKLLLLGTVIWGVLVLLTTGLVWQFLRYPEIADLVLRRTLSVAMTAAVGVTIIATTISSLGVLYLGGDLRLLTVSPMDWLPRYLGQLARAGMGGSWAVLLIFTPVLVAVGRLHGWPGAYVATAVIGGALLLVAASAAGTLVALLLAHLGGAGRARRGLALGAAAGGLGAWWLASRGGLAQRLLEAGEGTAIGVVNLLATPTSPWLPSDWWTVALVRGLDGALDWRALLALLGVAVASVALAAAAHGRWWRETALRVRGGVTAGDTGGGAAGWLQRSLERRIGAAQTAMLLKDLTRIVRATSDWSHWMLAGVGYTIYVTNLSVVMLAGRDPLSRLLAQAIGLMNLAVGGLILASIAVHVVLPALSLEGSALATLRTSPLGWGGAVRVKSWWATAILVPLGVLLSLGASWAVAAPAGLTVFGALLSAGLGRGIVGLALLFGTRHANFRARSAAELASGSGATMLLLSATMLTAIVMLLAAPLALQLMPPMAGTPTEITRLLGAIPPALALLAGALAAFLPVGVAHRAVGQAVRSRPWARAGQDH